MNVAPNVELLVKYTTLNNLQQLVTAVQNAYLEHARY